MSFGLWMAISWLGCSGDDPAPPATTTATGDTGETDTTPTTDTGYPLADMGTVLLAYHLDTRRAYAFGFFAESHAGFPNLAECAAQNVPCLPRLPEDDDTFIDFDPRAGFESALYETRYLGLETQFGPYTLQYYNTRDLESSFYFRDISEEVFVNGWITGWMGFGWSDANAMWVPGHEPVDDIFVPKPIELQRPAQKSKNFIPNGTRLPIEWIPTGEGEVFIRITQEFGLARYYKVADDGYWELDVDLLGFGAEPEEFNVSVQRWTRDTVRRKGNLIDVAAMTDASFDVTYFNIGNRDRITPADRCFEAQGQPALGPGGYWGRIEGYDNNSDGERCGIEALSGDALIKIQVEPKEAVSAVLNFQNASAAIYVLETCTNLDSCITGSDQSDQDAVPEFVSVFNPTEDPVTYFLVVDATEQPDNGDGTYTLDIENAQLVEPTMYDSCVEANQGQLLTAGTYYAEFTAYSNTLNAGVGGCTGTSLPGPDAMVPVELLAGETLDVGVQTTGADVAVYLLTDCTDAFSVPGTTCSDQDLGQNQQENITYTNGSGNTERLTLVIDSKTGIQPYFMSVQIY